MVTYNDNNKITICDDVFNITNILGYGGGCDYVYEASYKDTTNNETKVAIKQINIIPKNAVINDISTEVDTFSRIILPDSRATNKGAVYCSVTA